MHIACRWWLNVVYVARLVLIVFVGIGINRFHRINRKREKYWIQKADTIRTSNGFSCDPNGFLMFFFFLLFIRSMGCGVLFLF